MQETIEIRVDKLTHMYEKERVLSDISFQVRAGEFFIIAGPNGSGKTTLMKLLAGVIKKKNGNLYISEIPLENYSRKELSRRIAFVPQLVPVEFPFTVKEVVMSGRAPHQGLFGFERNEDIDIVKQAMEFTDITHLADRKIDRLSGGERQRVFIAAAICQEPDIILLDEPTSALDLAHQVKIMDLMEKLKTDKNITVVMISHDINLAAIYADTMLLLKDGRVIDSGSPLNVLNGDTLEDVFECKLIVDENPLGKIPRIVPVPERFYSDDCYTKKNN